MRTLLKLYHNPKIRIKAILVPVVIFMISSLVFVGAELWQNSDYYLKNMEEQQQKYNNIIAASLEELYQDGATDEDYAEYIRTMVEQSGNSWFYLSKDENMIFVRDDITTESLGRYKDYRSFMNSYSDTSIVRTSARFGNDRYEVGTVSAKDYLLNQGKVIKHIIYIGIAALLCTITYLALIIVLATKWNDADSNNKVLKAEIIEEKLKVEALLVQLEQDADSVEKNKRRYTMYNRNMAETLLEKSDDKALYPIAIIMVKVLLANKMYTRRQLYNMMQVIWDKLNANQIVAEIRKGEFAVLMYHTTEEEAQLLKERVFAEWSEMEDMHGVVVKASVIGTGDGNVKIMKRYEQCLDELRKEAGE